MSAAAAQRTRRGLTPVARRIIGIAAIVVVLAWIALGTKVVSNDDPLVQGEQTLDPAAFGAEQFPLIQEAVADRAVDAVELAEAIAADPAAAAEEYAVQSSGGPVYAVEFTGVVGDGQSGIHAIEIDGLPEDLLVRVQFGPAVNGTELRDATGEISFGQFRNQIEYQNAAAAINDELKRVVLADIDTAALPGSEVTVVGAFTLVNPKAWLVTPVEVTVG